MKAAGVERARTLATVLPDDSTMNVFVTLSARSLNRDLQIIARGEHPLPPRPSCATPGQTRWFCRPISAPSGSPN